MTDLMEKALASVGRWPESRQEEAAQMLLALDRLGSTYTASTAELAAVDEALRKSAAVNLPPTQTLRRLSSASGDESSL